MSVWCQIPQQPCKVCTSTGQRRYGATKGPNTIIASEFIIMADQYVYPKVQQWQRQRQQLVCGFIVILL